MSTHVRSSISDNQSITEVANEIATFRWENCNANTIVGSSYSITIVIRPNTS